MYVPRGAIERGCRPYHFRAQSSKAFRATGRAEQRGEAGIAPVAQFAAGRAVRSGVPARGADERGGDFTDFSVSVADCPHRLGLMFDARRA